MNCMHCRSDSRVLRIDGRERLRECNGCKRRWRSVELLLGHTRTALPATSESVLSLSAEGKTIKQIGEALHMSTRTVQRHLAAAPTLEGVWK
jgi:DNA-binding NarL/FixJ family response regulator